MEIKDLKQHIKELMSAMGRTGTKRLVIKHDDFELELERDSLSSEAPRTYDPSQGIEREATHSESIGRPLPTSTVPLPHESSHTIREKPPSTTEEGGHFITSPMVGTFYSTSSPESAPFVNVGNSINKEDVVCIIEAMKVMNEIKSGITGTVIEILVSNGDPVEFGTKLFRVR